MSCEVLHLKWRCDDSIPDTCPTRHSNLNDAVDVVRPHRREFRWPVCEHKNICSQICTCQCPVIMKWPYDSFILLIVIESFKDKMILADFSFMCTKSADFKVCLIIPYWSICSFVDQELLCMPWVVNLSLPLCPPNTNLGTHNSTWLDILGMLWRTKKNYDLF